MSAFNLLSADIINLVQDFAGINEYWARRFSVDVLPLINKQYRVVCIRDGEACAGCYKEAIMNGSTFTKCEECEDVWILQTQFDLMSFEEFANSKITRETRDWRVFVDAGFEATTAALGGSLYFSRNNGGLMYEFHRGLGDEEVASIPPVMKRLLWSPSA